MEAGVARFSNLTTTLEQGSDRILDFDCHKIEGCLLVVDRILIFIHRLEWVKRSQASSCPMNCCHLEIREGAGIPIPLQFIKPSEVKGYQGLY